MYLAAKKDSSSVWLLVTYSLKQSVKNRDLKKKNGLEKKQPAWKNRAIKNKI